MVIVFGLACNDTAAVKRIHREWRALMCRHGATGLSNTYRTPKSATLLSIFLFIPSLASFIYSPEEVKVCTAQTCTCTQSKSKGSKCSGYI